MAARRPVDHMNEIFNQTDNLQQNNQNANKGPNVYYSHSHSSPYVDGKRNTRFAHPSLVSNQVFYNEDSEKKEQQQNYRPSSVRNDKKNQYRTEERDNDWDNRPATSQNERRKDSYASNQRGHDDYNEPRYREEQHDNWHGERRDNGRYGEDDSYRNRVAGKPSQDYRDDRSESSNLSSAGYLCPNCLNRHLSEDQRELCRRQREEDMERERRLAETNSRLSKEEEAQERLKKSNRVNEARNLKDKLEGDYAYKLEYRRSPKKESHDSTFNTIFDKQDEFARKQKNLHHEFGAGLQDQMREEKHRRNQEKAWNSSGYNTSLQIGEGYHNKYLEGRPGNISSALKDQVEERAHNQKREREADKRLAQERSEHALREQEEEERRRKEKEWNQKRELKDQLLRTMEDKKNKQREELMSRQSERSKVDHAYEEYKRRQAEEEQRAKSQLFDFGKALKNQQENSSYKKQYDERRHQKDATSFDPSPSKIKKLYPCGDCHIPYEKAHLTKYH